MFAYQGKVPVVILKGRDHGATRLDVESSTIQGFGRRGYQQWVDAVAADPDKSTHWYVFGRAL